MKKTIKIIALCLSIVALTALFAGCDALDDMKANHAILSEDKETISFNGETYKKISLGTNFYFSTLHHYEDEIHLTDKDVPVLLSSAYGYECWYDEVKDLFSVYLNAETEINPFLSSFSYGEETYFCNEKDYDKYITAITENKLDHIGFEYEIGTEDYYYYYTLEAASKEVSDEILGHITNPEKMTEELYDKISDDYDTKALMSSMYKCDSEGLLVEYIDGYDIYRNPNGNAYLVNHITEKAVKLSDSTASALKTVYFYGDYRYEVYEEDYYDDSVGIIGSDDGETEFFVVNKY